jgi:hypothetical protein
MKTVVILGSGQMGKAVCKLLNPDSMKVTAFGDNNPDTWNINGNIQVLPVLDALNTNPDLVLIGVLDREREAELYAPTGSIVRPSWYCDYYTELAWYMA